MSAHILASAFVELLTPSVVLYLAIGVLLGTMIGALPGLSATMGVALITPITFWLDKVDGFAMLMGLWNAAIFAGGITAILINTPGTPASITQAWDGYPLSYKIRESKLFPKLFSHFLCTFKIKAYLCNQHEVEL